MEKKHIPIFIAALLSVFIATFSLTVNYVPRRPVVITEYETTPTLDETRITYKPAPIVEEQEKILLPIEINTAERSELLQLYGIGEVLCERIIAYRDNGGYFYSVNDLKKISGIGQNILDKNVGRIFVDTSRLPVQQTSEISAASEKKPPETTHQTVLGIIANGSDDVTQENAESKISAADEEASEKTEALEKNEPDFPLELNSCTEEELQFLNGIGPVMAARIVAYRAEKGAFYCIEDIMKVSGIGAATFEKIRGKIYVDLSGLPPQTDGSVESGEITTAAQQLTPVCLNTATAAQLAVLPGLNAGLAAKIVDFRVNTKGGAFASIEELLYIEGLTEGIFNKVKRYLYL